MTKYIVRNNHTQLSLNLKHYQLGLRFRSCWMKLYYPKKCLPKINKNINHSKNQ